ncbi:hypothetical protein EV426DRAFT_578570 [Tirmania nivea]|nr:hypothetical protein EV426DRAFT_578570 [Tirmania nivea]
MGRQSSENNRSKYAPVDVATTSGWQRPTRQEYSGRGPGPLGLKLQQTGTGFWHISWDYVFAADLALGDRQYLFFLSLQGPRKSRILATEHPQPNHGPMRLGKNQDDYGHSAGFGHESDTSATTQFISDRSFDALNILIEETRCDRGDTFFEGWCYHLQGVAILWDCRLGKDFRRAARRHLYRLFPKPPDSTTSGNFPDGSDTRGETSNTPASTTSAPNSSKSPTYANTFTVI